MYGWKFSLGVIPGNPPLCMKHSNVIMNLLVTMAIDNNTMDI